MTTVELLWAARTVAAQANLIGADLVEVIPTAVGSADTAALGGRARDPRDPDRDRDAPPDRPQLSAGDPHATRRQTTVNPPSTTSVVPVT